MAKNFKVETTPHGQAVCNPKTAEFYMVNESGDLKGFKGYTACSNARVAYDGFTKSHSGGKQGPTGISSRRARSRVLLQPFLPL